MNHFKKSQVQIIIVFKCWQKSYHFRREKKKKMSHWETMDTKKILLLNFEETHRILAFNCFSKTFNFMKNIWNPMVSNKAENDL